MALSDKRLKSEIKRIKQIMAANKKAEKDSRVNNEVNQIVLDALDFELNAEKFTTG